MNYKFLVPILAVAAFTLAACDNKQSGGSTTPPATTQEPAKPDAAPSAPAADPAKPAPAN
ncbi:putative lipoprotein YajG [Phyllobacterium myrsinacearum]|uniref:Putative lipoprotein YajG n=1 Tax=Phyllobacterium myrsinacearum TaxID=28101 RepID=A0A839EWI1_9HYPH|nr:putative lipoprotein YajG [Phyllobacterium myrsinacearum]